MVPLSGPTAGGTRIVITGVDLGGSVAVTLGDFDCEVVHYLIGRHSSQYIFGVVLTVCMYVCFIWDCVRRFYMPHFCFLYNEVALSASSIFSTLFFSYIAREIHCISPRVSSAVRVPINITVVRRSYVNISFANSNANTFSFVEPALGGVSPSYGPMSGGTSIVLRGIALNTGNLALTTVEMDQGTCSIQ